MMLAMLYAFVCQLREERIARAAVKRARDVYPAVWQRMGWVIHEHTHPSPPHKHVDVPPHEHDE